MSGPEYPGSPAELPGVRVDECTMGVVEIIARPGRAGELVEIARGRGIELPTFGRIAYSSDRLALCVRPDRWLLLLAPPAPAASGPDRVDWWESAAQAGAAVDQSSAWATLLLAGPRSREVLARGCRLDLDPLLFPVGLAAATIMAQVPVILAAVPSGLLLLTSASTARHFREWLAAAAKPFGLMPQSIISVADLCRSESG